MMWLNLKLLLVTSVGTSVATTPLKGFGVPSYWGNHASDYEDVIPAEAFMIINPNSGAIDISSSEIERYREIVDTVHNQGGLVLGYIPTGYNRDSNVEQTSWNTIEENMEAYMTIGGVDGFFWDEAGFEGNGVSDEEACDLTESKWSEIRRKMERLNLEGLTSVWNAGWGGYSDDNPACYIDAAQRGEHVITWEASYKSYKSNEDYLNWMSEDKARPRGVNTWLLVHTANESNMKDALKTTKADYVYVTSVEYDPDQEWGGPVWNSVPSFWDREIQCLENLQNGRSC